MHCYALRLELAIKDAVNDSSSLHRSLEVLLTGVFNCSHCGQPFKKKTKGFKWQKLHSASQFSAAEVIQRAFKLPITPADKQSTKRFLFPQCIQSLTTIKQSGEMQAKSTAEFLEKMSETSYISQKMLKREPTPPQSPTRCPPVMNTPSPSHRGRCRLGVSPGRSSGKRKVCK